MIWDPNTREFIELNDHEFRIEPEEFGDPDDLEHGAGLAAAILFGSLFWGCVALAIFEPWSRTALASIGVVCVIVFLIWASGRIVDRFRDEHPESPIVDWLRRSGL